MFKLEEHIDDVNFINYINEIKKPLQNSIDGLKSDLVKWKEKAREFEGIDVAELKSAKIELDKLKEDTNKNETELQKAMRIANEQYQNDIKTVKEELETIRNRNRLLIVDDALRSEFVSIGVKPVLIDAAINIIKPLVSVIAENGVEKATIGDKTIKDYVKEWSDTEVGKNFILAKQNFGGGAIGFGNKTESELVKFFDKKSKTYNVTEQLKIKKSNPELYSKLLKSFD